LKLDVPQAEVFISGRPRSLRLALLTLMLNSLDSIPQGGTLGIKLASADVSLELSPSDAGPEGRDQAGVDVFDLDLTRQPLLSGIGQYVARSIVESHGGVLSLERSPPDGSKLWIRFPAVS
jgi:signal transduction histidine kinase